MMSYTVCIFFSRRLRHQCGVCVECRQEKGRRGSKAMYRYVHWYRPVLGLTHCYFFALRHVLYMRSIDHLVAMYLTRPRMWLLHPELQLRFHP
jgi:hypothetical protein